MFLIAFIARSQDENENDSNYKKRIYTSSQKFENNCLYGLHHEFIEINPLWINYLK
jgi:hypothetical protein